MIDNSRPGTLYRLFDAEGKLLYVGASVNAPGRLETHRRDKSWWPEVARATFEHFETRHLAIVEEARAIDTEEPKYNKAPGRMCANPDDLAARRLTREQVTRRRNARTMYPVADLRCGHCDWSGGWVKKGMAISEAPCPNCGLHQLSGTPLTTEVAA